MAGFVTGANLKTDGGFAACGSRAIELNRRNDMTTTAYPPIATGLLLVDPYNDSLSEGGRFLSSVKSSPRNTGAKAAFRTRSRFPVEATRDHQGDPDGISRLTSSRGPFGRGTYRTLEEL